MKDTTFILSLDGYEDISWCFCIFCLKTFQQETDRKYKLQVFLSSLISWLTPATPRLHPPCTHLKRALSDCSEFHHPIIRLHSSQPPANHEPRLPFSTHSAWSCTGAPSVTNGLYELLIAGRVSGGTRSSAWFLISSLKSHGKKTGS